MKIHYLQHVPFEDLAAIGEWAAQKNFSVAGTHLYLDEKLPNVSDYDWLIILGGPMNIYEDAKYPWLAQEKELIREAIQKEKTVLGICLGAQLIAHALGARVTKNAFKEVGWHPIRFLPQIETSSFFKGFPETQMAFHWHGDTFEIPQGCSHIASSEVCKNQAFEYAGNVVGLQFHLESTPTSIQNLISNCPDDLLSGRYVQNAKSILSGTQHLPKMHQTMFHILNRMANPQKGGNRWLRNR